MVLLLLRYIRGISKLIFIKLIQWFISILQGFSFNFEFDGGVINTVMGIIDFIAYILPLNTIFAITMISFALMGYRIAVSIFKTIMEILPIV